MRLSEFRDLPKKQQDEEVKKALVNITVAGEKLDKLGTWYESNTKDVEYKNGGVEYTLWQAN